LRIWLVLAIVAALTVPMLALGAGTPSITLTENAPASVVFGGTADVSLTAANPSGPYGYNLSFTDVLPAGVSYVPGSSTPDPTVIANAPGAARRRSSGPTWPTSPRTRATRSTLGSRTPPVTPP
jgi:uncharacterized repeat protein (TIGR01451 family)